MPADSLSSNPADSASERLQQAQEARRRLFVRGVSLLVGGLTLLAVANMLALSAPRSTVLASAFALVGYAVAYFLSQRRPKNWLGACALLITMQVQHVVSALTVHELSEAANAIMFSGILPLIAAATLGIRGTVISSVAAVLAVPVVILAKISAGGDPTLIGRALGAPQFFVLMGAVVGILSNLAERRSMVEQLAREQSATQARVAAERAERRLRLVADQVSDLVAVLDAKGRHTFVSASYERILGLSPGDLLGKPSPDLVHPDDREAAGRCFAEALTGQACELVARLRAKEGQYRTFHLRMLGVEVDGKPQVAITSRDITDLQALSAELESVRRMEALGRLAGGVAHDFNNLLSVIGSCASMLRSQQASGRQRGQRDLDIIDDAVQKAALLTGQLLSFARRQVLPFGSTVPAEALSQLQALLARAVGTHVQLSIDVSSSCWEAPLSTGALEQIIMNLAVNARDAMAEGGTLSIRVVDRHISAGEVADLQVGDHIVIEVADSGAGIDPTLKSRIFEPFFTTKAPGKGTGLGLSTSFGVARQVGGTLTVDSTPGQGSTFRVYLPRAEPASVRAKPEVRWSPRPASTSGSTVLVVDDEERIGELVARLLEMAGHQVVATHNSAMAIKAAKGRSFDVMLVDVVLGQEDGLDVLARLREIQPRARCVVMSGYSPSPQRLEALRDTGIEFLAKPFAVGALLRAVAPHGPSELLPSEDEA